MSQTAYDISAELSKLSDPDRAINSARFFKTGPGEYGEGDRFIGVRVPQQRQVAKKFRDLPLAEIVKLLKSSVHEERLTALIILVDQFKHGHGSNRQQIYDFYLANTAYVNNWDLVDSSAPYIVGGYLADKDRSILRKLAQSESLWERRIAILATFYFIRDGESEDAFIIAELLLHDKHDLIHKAVGWMLREVGKSCGQDIEEAFLQQHYRVMPRTMLRYAIERFKPELRSQYLEGSV